MIHDMQMNTRKYNLEENSNIGYKKPHPTLTIPQP